MIDDLSPNARALLRAASTSDDPSDDDLARVRQAVLTRVGAAGVAAALVSAGSMQARAASVGIGAKLGIAVAFAVGGVAVWGYLASPPAAPSSWAARAPVARHDRALGSPIPISSAPSAVQMPRVAASTPSPAHNHGQPGALSSRTSDLESEMGLIQSADAALRSGNSTKAIVLLNRHQGEHAAGLLAHEREGLRALAHCQQGGAGGPVMAKQFLQRSPRSPLAARLRRACKVVDAAEKATSSESL